MNSRTSVNANHSQARAVEEKPVTSHQAAEQQPGMANSDASGPNNNGKQVNKSLLGGEDAEAVAMNQDKRSPIRKDRQ